MRAFMLADCLGYLRFHDLPGEEPPILFVHGLGCASSCDYPRIAADPALGGRRALLVDLLGFGFSDRPEGFGYAVEDHASTLNELVEALKLDRFDLVGHSMGGAVAIALAARNPGRVRRLALSEPNLDPGGGVFSTPISRMSKEEYLARGHAATVEKAESDGHRIWSASLRLSSPLAVYRGAVSLVRGGSPGWRGLLESLAIPRTVIFGARSLPDPDTERLPRAGIAVLTVPEAGHSMAWENPSGYAEAIGAALA